MFSSVFFLEKIALVFLEIHPAMDHCGVDFVHYAPAMDENGGVMEH